MDAQSMPMYSGGDPTLDNPDPLPSDYAATFDVIAPGFTDQMPGQAQPGESWIDTATKLMTTLIMTDQQRRLMSVNLDRARKGLPPIDAASYGMGVNVGLSPATRQLVVIGGLVLAGLLVMNLVRK